MPFFFSCWIRSFLPQITLGVSCLPSFLYGIRSGHVVGVGGERRHEGSEEIPCTSFFSPPPPLRTNSLSLPAKMTPIDPSSSSSTTTFHQKKSPSTVMELLLCITFLCIHNRTHFFPFSGAKTTISFLKQQKTMLFAFWRRYNTVLYAYLGTLGSVGLAPLSISVWDMSEIGGLLCSL